MKIRRHFKHNIFLIDEAGLGEALAPGSDSIKGGGPGCL
jgi:hypothetical protein